MKGDVWRQGDGEVSFCGAIEMSGFLELKCAPGSPSQSASAQKAQSYAMLKGGRIGLCHAHFGLCCTRPSI